MRSEHWHLSADSPKGIEENDAFGVDKIINCANCEPHHTLPNLGYRTIQRGVRFYYYSSDVEP